MNPTQSAAAQTLAAPVSATEQARTIRKAQSAGHAVLPWSATLVDGRAVILLAVTERSARSLAPNALRVAPASIRDVAGLVARALAAAPPPKAPAATTAPRKAAAAPKAPAAPKDPAFEREWAALLADEARENAARAVRAYWLTGEGPRPTLPVVRRQHVAGEPRSEITARPRPGVGAPFVGEASLIGTGRGVRVAHEYVPARAAAPVWAPRA